MVNADIMSCNTLQYGVRRWRGKKGKEAYQCVDVQMIHERQVDTDVQKET